MSTASSSSLVPATASDSDRSRRIPKWVPVFAFVGTSLSLAIPLYMIRRQRGAGLRMLMKMKDSAPPPPRRTSSTTGNFDPKSITAGSASPSTTGVVESFSSEGASPGIGEMMSALSRMNASSALMAAKAFGIATALVAAGGMGLMWGVKTTLGVNDAREFGQKMRYLLWASVPSLASRIHRPPETEEERHQIHEFAPFGIEGGSSTDEEWTWEKAERRLKKAYDEGGLPLWSQAALREVEAEARIERIKRQEELASRVSRT